MCDWKGTSGRPLDFLPVSYDLICFHIMYVYKFSVGVISLYLKE